MTTAALTTSEQIVGALVLIKAQVETLLQCVRESGVVADHQASALGRKRRLGLACLLEGVLRDEGVPLTSADLAKRLAERGVKIDAQIPRNTVYATLWRSRDRFTRTSDGRWRLASAG